jgi:sporulation protein YlmC with PRC-barrel domain
VNNIKKLLGKPVDATDGAIGSVYDLYFDEQTWSVRYLVVDTGRWLPGRKVLAIPDAIQTPWHHEDVLSLNLTQEAIESSPEIDTAAPVSRLTEDLLHRHYSWTPYWADLTTVPVPSPAPSSSIRESTEDRHEAEQEAERLTAPPLRSAKEVQEYRVEATDGKVGRVEDLLIDDDFRRILFLAIRVDGLLFGKQVLSSPRLVARVDSSSSIIYIDTTRQAIKSGQEYNPAA